MNDSKKYIQLLVDKIENLNRQAVCHVHEDIPKEIYDFLREDGSKKTNFEEIKENLDAVKMAFLMFNVPRYCPYKYGCNECKHYDENNLGLCFAKANWTEQNYLEWLEQEVEE